MSGDKLEGMAEYINGLIAQNERAAGRSKEGWITQSDNEVFQNKLKSLGDVLSEVVHESAKLGAAVMLGRLEQMQIPVKPKRDDLSEAKRLRPKEVSALWRVKEGTLANWRAKNIGPKFHREGKSVIYMREDVEEYFNKFDGSAEGL
jgi:hypothetical protein